MSTNTASPQLTVESSMRISDNMQRMVFTTDSFEIFDDFSPGAYIKLKFFADGTPVQAHTIDQQPQFLRTYSVRSVDINTQKISLDMVVHPGKAEGLSATWAISAKTGDTIAFRGMGKSKALASEYDWVLFAGDMTALPSIASYLEALPANTKGHAVFQVTSPMDILNLAHPSELKLHWVVGDNDSFMQTLNDIHWYDGVPAVWAAGEFSLMRSMRTFFSKTKNVPRDQLYISSYWRKGRCEEEHKVDKRKDAAEYASNSD